MLQTSWKRCWSELNAQGDGSALLQKLVSAYEEPQRKYHTIQHLSECLSLLSRNLHLAIEPGEVEMALWFHDAIYNVRAHDNEARSADWAGDALSRAGVAAERIERVRRLILATRHVALPEGHDQMLLVEIDLSILGACRVRFDEYESQVREEYAWVPESLFRQKRAELLTEFLARQPVYNTPQLREILEHQARENLAHSLSQLRGGFQQTTTEA
jgi:predicted metal-dependent HD superfamily phosphohydrolase